MANRSQQFSVAVHILCFLEFNKNDRTTSELLAMSVNANSAVIRRIMQKLTKAGLITSTLGTNAAITLVKQANQITLLDVYRATLENNQDLFIIHQDTNPTCPVGSKIPHLLDGVYSKVQATMENELSSITIDQLVKSGIVQGGNP
ncbi:MULTISPECIES: Rrf2 family transcriptional regulator [Paenibacillus]|uniref:Rrf2 family transcriptional regulator n=1 Tax=Paenibacillus cookii TaxID=157839 RepID=A0ABQ4M4I1_9BACL|nr:MULTISPECIES: Rrf2 family transcriptional regulator [Paenibacillus]KHF28771.1 putative HTH-type transcriptional regulator YwnA [Paenibacillus sp. P1XP2]GIO70444.1 Rrf2 family transcriptional regulator [Paenibacillus cookii]